MATRVHTAIAESVGVDVLPERNLIEHYGMKFAGAGQALVIEDPDGDEALVLFGDLDHFVDFATQILTACRRAR